MQCDVHIGRHVEAVEVRAVCAMKLKITRSLGSLVAPAEPPGASKKYTTQAVPRRSVHDGKKHHDHILADYSFIAVGRNSVLCADQRKTKCFFPHALS